MIDFKNGTFVKLKATGGFKNQALVEPLFIPGEVFISEYQGIRDFVIFTNKRVISTNVQGITGKKKDFTSMPYSKITVFSVETSGVLDLDSELEMYFSGVGKVKFEFSGRSDIVQIGRIIGEYVMK